MSSIDKLISQFLSLPNDFKWSQFTRIMKHYGYESLPKGKTGGSREKFFNSEKNSLISLHKPHKPNTLKIYQIKEVIEKLKEAGLINNE